MRNYSRKQTCSSPFSGGVFSRGIQRIVSPVTVQLDQDSASNSAIGMALVTDLKGQSCYSGSSSFSTTNKDPFIIGTDELSNEIDSSVEILRDAETSMINLPITGNSAGMNEIYIQNIEDASKLYAHKNNPDFCSTVLYDMADAVPELLDLTMDLSSISCYDTQDNMFTNSTGTKEDTYTFVIPEDTVEEETLTITEPSLPELEYFSLQESTKVLSGKPRYKSYDDYIHNVEEPVLHSLENVRDINCVKTSTPVPFRQPKADAMKANMQLYNNDLSAIQMNKLWNSIPVLSDVDEKENSLQSDSVEVTSQGENLIQDVLETTPIGQMSTPKLVTTKGLHFQRKKHRSFKAHCSTSLFHSERKCADNTQDSLKGAIDNTGPELSPSQIEKKEVQNVNMPNRGTTSTPVASLQLETVMPKFIPLYNNDLSAIALENTNLVMPNLAVSFVQSDPLMFEVDNQDVIQASIQKACVKSTTYLHENPQNGQTNLNQSHSTSKKRKRKSELLNPWDKRRTKKSQMARKTCEPGMSKNHRYPECQKPLQDPAAHNKGNPAEVKICDIICCRNPTSKSFKVQTFHKPLGFNRDYRDYPLDVLMT